MDFSVYRLSAYFAASDVGENDSNFPAVLAQGVNKLVAAVTAEREVFSGDGGEQFRQVLVGVSFHSGIPALTMAENNSPRSIGLR